MEILRCENLNKVYGSGDNRVVALEQINIAVNKGEFVAIVGASGSGKSTLLHILGSVDKPTEGRVVVEGRDISSLSPAQSAIFRRRKVGLVYQFYNLIPTLTVKNNILMPLLLDKKKPNLEYFDEVVNSLGLSDKLEALPNQLSGGQQQRTAIARALIYRPALLLADEPTGNLDRKNSKEIMDMLKLSNRNLKQTILLITHDENIALEADRIVTIEDGRIIRDQKRGVRLCGKIILWGLSETTVDPVYPSWWPLLYPVCFYLFCAACFIMYGFMKWKRLFWRKGIGRAGSPE